MNKTGCSGPNGNAEANDGSLRRGHKEYVDLRGKEGLNISGVRYPFGPSVNQPNNRKTSGSLSGNGCGCNPRMRALPVEGRGRLEDTMRAVTVYRMHSRSPGHRDRSGTDQCPSRSKGRVATMGCFSAQGPGREGGEHLRDNPVSANKRKGGRTCMKMF